MEAPWSELMADMDRLDMMQKARHRRFKRDLKHKGLVSALWEHGPGRPTFVKKQGWVT